MTALTDSTGRVLPPVECPSDVTLRAYGKLFFLTLRSPRHAGMRAVEMRNFLEPPLVLGQFRVFEIEGVPRAFLTWAWLSPEAARRLVGGKQLTPEDWNSGDQLWIVDMVAPYRGLASGVVRWIMAPGNFTDDAFYFRRVSAENRTRRIMHIDFHRPGIKKILTEAEYLAGL